MNFLHNIPRFVRDNLRTVALVTAILLTIGGVFLVRALTSEDDGPRGQARPAAPSTDMMGMDMSGDGSVQLTAAQLREFGVTFGTVELRPLAGELRTVGAVVVDETRQAIVTPKFGGFIERLYVDFTGSPVRRGQPLLEIYAPELIAAQEELLLAARLAETSATSRVPGAMDRPVDLVASARQRLRLWDVSDAQIDEILRSGRARRTITMYSPATGVVLEKNVVQGQGVAAGATLFRIADLSRVWIEVQVREADAEAVVQGANATIELTSAPGRLISGRVEYVYPTVEEQARVLRARIAVANPGGLLRPGMYATVHIAAPSRTALTVPLTAVVNTGERRLVFVDYGSGRITPQEVVIGRVAGDYAEVIAGLEPGQRVVTSAQFLIDSESNLGAVMRSMMSQGTGAMESMDMSDRGADMRGMQMPPSRK